MQTATTRYCGDESREAILFAADTYGCLQSDTMDVMEAMEKEPKRSDVGRRAYVDYVKALGMIQQLEPVCVKISVPSCWRCRLPVGVAGTS